MLLNTDDCSHGYHFTGISGNLEMSGNSVKVRDKSGISQGKGTKSGKGRGICVVRDI